MARRLNIERRRKRIRHYAARRRRRSPLHRALMYWWGPGIVLLVMLLLLAKLTVHFVFDGIGTRRVEAYSLPEASLRLVYMSQSEINDRLRMGNARRIAVAMSDADIGLSLDVALPEPGILEGKALPPLLIDLPVSDRQKLSEVSYLPQAYVAPERAPVARVRMVVSEELEAARFTLGALPKTPKGESSGRADFWVMLDERGRVETVLRASPFGEETAWQKRLRVYLGTGLGTSAGRGRVTIYWTAEEVL